MLNSHPRSARPLAGFGRILGPDGGEIWQYVRAQGESPQIPVTNSGFYTMCLSARRVSDFECCVRSENTHNASPCARTMNSCRYSPEFPLKAYIEVKVDGLLDQRKLEEQIAGLVADEEEALKENAKKSIENV